MKNRKKGLRRIAAVVLAAALAGNSLDLSVFAENGGSGTGTATITAFTELSEAVKTQTLETGAGESALDLPTDLEVTVELQAAENSGKQMRMENEATEQETPDESQSETQDESQTEEQDESQPGKPDESQTEGQPEPAPEPEPETPASKMEQQESEGSILTSFLDVVFPAMTVYAAELQNSQTVTLTGITWKIDAEKSSTAELRASEAVIPLWGDILLLKEEMLSLQAAAAQRASAVEEAEMVQAL